VHVDVNLDLDVVIDHGHGLWDMEHDYK
jgi:hypothetical protein